DLADHGGQFHRRLEGAVEIRRAVRVAVALGRDDFPNKDVVGYIAAEGLAQPGVEGVGRPGPQLFAVDPQQVCPLHGPVVGKLGPCNGQTCCGSTAKSWGPGRTTPSTPGCANPSAAIYPTTSLFGKSSRPRATATRTARRISTAPSRRRWN